MSGYGDFSTTIAKYAPLEAQLQSDRQIEATEAQQTIRRLTHKFMELLFVCHVAVIGGC
jgi:hypothetical protein